MLEIQPTPAMLSLQHLPYQQGSALGPAASGSDAGASLLSSKAQSLGCRAWSYVPRATHHGGIRSEKADGGGTMMIALVGTMYHTQVFTVVLPTIKARTPGSDSHGQTLHRWRKASARVGAQPERWAQPIAQAQDAQAQQHVLVHPGKAYSSPGIAQRSAKHCSSRCAAPAAGAAPAATVPSRRGSPGPGPHNGGL